MRILNTNLINLLIKSTIILTFLIMGSYLSGIRSSSAKHKLDKANCDSSTSSTNTNNLTSTTSISSSSNKKANISKMAVVLKPTVKQTATVIFLHGLGDTGY